ncbi:MAG: ABC transporter permease [Acetobacteraceae bacterium]|nr:ABC transporter permease [Acetobacteraceae bacterium]
MTGYVLRRLMQMLPVLLVASVGVWGMIYAVPGGPAGMILGENATAEQVAALHRELGLDQPILSQYWIWLSGALGGNMGRSIFSHQPVASLIAERLPATLQLGLFAILVGLALGMPVAIVSAIRPDGWVDRLLAGWSALALGVPTFWLGILLILLFAVDLRLLPSASAHVPFYQDPLAMLRNLLLPALTLGTYVSGIFARFLRASLLEQLSADYVRTARAKGLPERDVIGSHALRNALLPFVTVVGLMTANFIGGAVVTEAVFTYPGLGQLLVQAISTRDYPLIQGCILVIMVIYMIANIVVDVIYAYIDPRIEYA